MPNPISNVSNIWYELCRLRMEHITNTVRQCQSLCEQSKMKFCSCATPIYSAIPNYARYQSYLPFNNRTELLQWIRETCLRLEKNKEYQTELTIRRQICLVIIIVLLLM